MSNPISLSHIRWDRSDGKPSSHSVRDVLEVALAKLDSGEITPDHIVVCYGQVKELTNNSGYLQAGTFNSYAQIGLLQSTMTLMAGGE